MAFEFGKGKLSQFQRIYSHPDTAAGPFGSADIHVSPDGKFLYASNRAKENNLAIFRIDERNGKLTSVGYQSTLGEKPRNFCIDPTGNFLLVANQDTDNIVIFKRDKQTGLLTETGEQVSVPRPVCLKLLEK
jgi:6-phosphogluconolactonase